MTKLHINNNLIGFILVLILSNCKTEVDSYNFEYTHWDKAHGDNGNSHYSTLSQINKENVHQLKQVWRFDSDDFDNTKDTSYFFGGTTIECNAIIVEGILYCTTPTLDLIALDGKSGELKWRYKPHQGKEKGEGGVNRGITYWEDKEDKRIFYGVGNYLHCVNISDGKNVTSFGEEGKIKLGYGSHPETGGGVYAFAAPVIYKDNIIVSETCWSKHGNVSAYKISNGERVWTFHNIPHPGEYGYDSYEDTTFYSYGPAANAWGGIAIDPKEGLVYITTGSPEGDFYRPFNAGQHLYGNCIVAIDANTGKRVWHYQTLHHDLWDLDMAAPPILADFKRYDKIVPGLIALSKTGNTYLFNRVTGEVLSEIEERDVPASTLFGEHAYPTQPYVINPEPFTPQIFTEDLVSDISPEVKAYCMEQFKQYESGWFVPPSEKGIIFMGVDGGAEWGGGAYDPQNNHIYINANINSWIVQAMNREKEAFASHPGYSVYSSNRCITCHGAELEGNNPYPTLKNTAEKWDRKEIINIIQQGKGAMPGFSNIKADELKLLVDFLMNQEAKSEENKPKVGKNGRPYTPVGLKKFGEFLDQEGYPGNKPPWATLNAIDVNTGKISWTVTLGEHEKLTKKGIPITGTKSFGGPIVTAGGLIFIASTMDEKIRAFDKDSGKILWEAKLPYGGYTTPSTYLMDGKQYIVIPCGGGGKPFTQSGDAFVAFALP